jgi:hypothetical protein
MSALKRLSQILGLGGTISLMILVVLILMFIGPLMLIGGMNLMGFEIEYSFKSFLGAALVLISFRSVMSRSKSS